MRDFLCEILTVKNKKSSVGIKMLYFHILPISDKIWKTCGTQEE